jgi:hypothetical protein
MAVIKVLNLDKCIRKIEGYGKIDLQPAMVWASRVVQTEAKRLVRKKTRTLERSIHRKVVKDSQKVNGAIGLVYTTLEYGPYLEFGTSKGYTIVPKGKQALFWAGADHPVKKVYMPPKTAYPFMRPALQKHGSTIKAKITEYIKAELSKINSK